MKKQILILILFIILLTSVQAVNYPTIKPFINDFANILDSANEGKLNDVCLHIEAETGVEVVIVTVKTTNGQDRVTYANRLGDQAGVGKADTDNGIVVLWSLSNEKGGAIATGRGIESTLTDIETNSIGRGSRPLFDNGKYYEGFRYILNEIQVEVGAGGITDKIVNIEEVTEEDIWSFLFIIIAIIVILFILMSIIDLSGGDWGGIVIGGFSRGSLVECLIIVMVNKLYLEKKYITKKARLKVLLDIQEKRQLNYYIKQDIMVLGIAN